MLIQLGSGPTFNINHTYIENVRQLFACLPHNRKIFFRLCGVLRTTPIWLKLARNSWMSLEIHGNCLKCPEMAWSGWKWMEIAEKGCKLVELAGSGGKWIEIDGNSWKWLLRAWIGWKCIWSELTGMAYSYINMPSCKSKARTTHSTHLNSSFEMFNA